MEQNSIEVKKNSMELESLTLHHGYYCVFSRDIGQAISPPNTSVSLSIIWEKEEYILHKMVERITIYIENTLDITYIFYYVL